MKRNIDQRIWRDEFFCSLTMTERLLWIGMVNCVADDQGRMLDNPLLIRADIFPLDDIQAAEITGAIEKFATAGKIYRYEKSGKKLIQIVNWWIYQSGSSWMGISLFPSPDGWTDRAKYHTKGNEIKILNWDHPGGWNGHKPQELSNQLCSELPSNLDSPLDRRESESESESDSEVESESESDVEQEVEPKTAAAAEDDAGKKEQICKAAGIPNKYHADLLKNQMITSTDILAELARSYSRKDVKRPGIITAMNLLNGETANAEFYEPDAWTEHIPAPIMTKLGQSLLQELITARKPVPNCGYTNFAGIDKDRLARKKYTSGKYAEFIES